MTPVKHSDLLSSGAGQRTGALCERARSWAALALDGELSELERKLLRAHVMRCADCSRFEVEVAAVTRELRALALEPLSRTIAIPAPHGRPAHRRLRTAGATAVVVGDRVSPHFGGQAT